MRSGRYGSSADYSRGRKTTGFNETTVTVDGGGDNNNNNNTSTGKGGDFSRSFNFGLTSKTRGPGRNDGSAPWNDEVELVSNAQGRSTHESEADEEELPKGIMRKTEVTHVVTYAVREGEAEEDRYSGKAGSR